MKVKFNLGDTVESLVKIPLHLKAKFTPGQEKKILRDLNFCTEILDIETVAVEKDSFYQWDKVVATYIYKGKTQKTSFKFHKKNLTRKRVKKI